VKDLAGQLGENEATLLSLHRRLEQLKRLPFLVPHSPESAVERILGYLEKGLTVVLEFGRYRDIVPYMLVANLLSRRIHDQYVQRSERARGEGAPHPRPLVISIEEAHRFLSPELSRQTIFGTIAREMRKSYVTLLVIDQRPSGIDEEVMSQVGSKITCLLDNEKDIDSVLAGVSERTELRKVLSRLESRQQALIFGHALPVPVVVRVRDYTSIYGKPLEQKGVEQDRKDLWEE
jgi:DNA helicase HerA-like ATPase